MLPDNCCASAAGANKSAWTCAAWLPDNACASPAGAAKLSVSSCCWPDSAEAGPARNAAGPVCCDRTLACAWPTGANVITGGSVFCDWTLACTWLTGTALIPIWPVCSETGCCANTCDWLPGTANIDATGTVVLPDNCCASAAGANKFAWTCAAWPDSADAGSACNCGWPVCCVTGPGRWRGTGTGRGGEGGAIGIAAGAAAAAAAAAWAARLAADGPIALLSLPPPTCSKSVKPEI